MKTKTTDSSRSSRSAPEEEVRQAFLRKMIGGLGFPKGLISVEKAVGKRRADIICYTNEMKPLLLIECKAVKLTDAALQQALGYNETIKAPFICLVNESETITFWFEGGKRVSVPFLPKFQELYDASKRL